MPTEATQFKNKIAALQTQRVDGQFAYLESPVQRHPYASYGFNVCTGGVNSLIADVQPGQSANVVLIPDNAVPAGMRPYITRCDVDVQGVTAWSTTSPTGVPSATVQDGAGAPLLFLPFNALRGLAGYTFPDSDCEIPTTLAVASYAAASGVITFANAATPNSNLITGTALAGTPFTVVGGTGLGQSGLIASYTGGNGSTLTPVTPLPIPLDTTSVVAVWYWQASGGSTTTAAFSNAFFASNALDNGYNLVAVVSANSPGSVRPIISNTGTTPTIATGTPFQGAIAAGDVMHITNNGSLLGAMDLCVVDKWSSAGVGRGLQIAVNLAGGTSPAGSNLRVAVEGYFAL